MGVVSLCLGVFGGLRRGGKKPATKRLGDRGEREAARLLRRAGYRVVGRNVRVPMGEADLVCVSPGGDALVVVEVKSRTAVLGGGPAAQSNVDERKRRKLVSIAKYLAKANGLEDRPVRVDVVTVVFDDGQKKGRPRLEHFVGAVKA